MSSVIIFAVFVIVGLIVKKLNGKSPARSRTNPYPRMQRLVERIQAEQRGNQPTQSRGRSGAAGQPGQQVPPYQSPPAGRGTGGRTQQSKPPKGDFDKRVREMMASGNEVGAVRLLCDEQDMGIIEAQSYARALVAGPGRAPRRTGESAARPDPGEGETRYVGSAAFAESVFSTDPDENVWASGWVEKPEQDDRTDIDELWQTVQNNGRPAAG
jgi:hypothetical protein